jgi:hypothetical protein
MPIEDDANAAASLFTRRVRLEASRELSKHDKYGPLVRAKVGPEPFETLVSRMLGFLLQYRAALEDIAAEENKTLEGLLLERVSASAASKWKAFVAI